MPTIKPARKAPVKTNSRQRDGIGVFTFDCKLVHPIKFMIEARGQYPFEARGILLFNTATRMFAFRDDRRCPS
nr:hypothetical protein [Candidatus Sigynarchaeota archaeon]